MNEKWMSREEEHTFRRVQPSFFEKGYNKEIAKDLESEIYMTDRTIFITGPITADYANSTIMQLMCLAKSKEPLTIIINSGGGEINAGLAIYDYLQILESQQIPITTIAVGMAGSMAAVLLASGQKGRRKILPHSEVMIHEPLIRGGVGGSTSSIRNISESLIKTRSMMNEILSKHTGKDLETIERDTSFDNYMSATEALEYGIVDEIVTDSLF